MGGQEEAVVGIREFHRCSTGVFRMFAGFGDDGNERVVVVDQSPGCFEFFNQDIAGRLPVIVDIRLVGETENENFAAIDGFFLIIESGHGAADDVIRHGPVDLAGEFDELGIDAEFASLPSKVERIDGDAVTTEPGSRVEGGESEGFGGGGTDDLPNIDAHRIGDRFEFVDETDIDRAIDVFEQLGELGNLGGGDGHDLVESGSVEGVSSVHAGGGVAADDFRDVGGGELRVTGVLALWGIDNEDGVTGDQSASFDTGNDFLHRRAGVGGAFEAEDGGRRQVRTHGAERVTHIGKIGLEMVVERSGNTENEGIHLTDTGEV